MNLRKDLVIKLHNWRIFKESKFALPRDSFVIIDTNGSGKTSLISAFYTLFTGRSWPGTKFMQNLRVGEGYLGLSTEYSEWALTGQISPSGRLSTKYLKLPEDCYQEALESNLEAVQWPKVLTYLPTDNYWFNQSRTAKLDILNNLLNQVIGQRYYEALDNLNKSVTGKQKLIKHVLENELNADNVMLTTLNAEILAHSIKVWELRKDFFEFINQNLANFTEWVDSPLKNWKINWEVTNKFGNKDKLQVNSFNFNHISQADLDNLWQRELASAKVLFGAQRDDFWIDSDHLKLEESLSRGEMRIFILYFKNLAKQYSRKLHPEIPIFWLLDDVFNELDDYREEILIKEFLESTDYFIATTTKSPIFKIKTRSLKDLTIS